ncbi:MAG: histidine phosphatase family protein [Saprospiraceae bacterium]|nr:histidine phosphatase family protein [Saprospiraceae bacterium]MDZ4706359.1 histidine phosphatase family protein [Saprospiraceae bacterium]
MKTIYFVRHAKSSWGHPTLRDIERPLEERGLRDAPFMAKVLKSEGAEPDLLLSSPATRAYSTALYFADAFEIDRRDVQLEPRIYEAFAEDILDIISKLPDEAHTVLLFGHNPTFTTIANRFSNKYIDNVPTCGIFKVEAKVNSWKEFKAPAAVLTAFHYPKQY